MSANPIADKRIRAMLDGHLMDAYWESVARLGTKDLVALIEADKRGASVDVMERQELIANPELPPYLKLKLAKPASEVSHILTSSDGAFWVVAAFDDIDEVTCVSVNAKHIAPGGSA